MGAVKRKSRPRQTALQEKMCKVLSKIKKGEEPVLEEDNLEKEHSNENTNIAENSSSSANGFTKISKRVEKLQENIASQMTEVSSILLNSQPGPSNKNIATRKRAKITNSQIPHKADNKQSKAQKTIEIENEIFPDDSFNAIVSQMPESELKQLTGENLTLQSPVYCRSKQGLLCSTPRLSDSHNDSSFEMQMSQMNESQYQHFMED